MMHHSEFNDWWDRIGKDRWWGLENHAPHLSTSAEKAKEIALMAWQEVIRLREMTILDQKVLTCLSKEIFKGLYVGLHVIASNCEIDQTQAFCTLTRLMNIGLVKQHPGGLPNYALSSRSGQ